MLIDVAVPVPGLGLLTYRVPEGGRVPEIGARVVVTVGSRAVTGIVVDNRSHDTASRTDIKPIRQLLDERAFVPAEVIDLARWTAEYYAAGPGAAIMAVLPPKSRGARADSHLTMRVAEITAQGRAVAESGGSDGLVAIGGVRPPTPRQREILGRLAAARDGIATSELAGGGVTSGDVARLVRRGLVAVRRDRVERDPFGSVLETPCADADRVLTQEQAAALDRLIALASEGRFRTAVVHGVTGSGKTEIYVRVSAAVRSSGRTVLMLVPEIALTPAVATRFRQAFGSRVAIQHSGLSDGERHDQWQRIRRGETDVVVGTRSAVFAPLERIGVVIVDEEHDASYKQEESPRYNARDVAVVRAQRSNALAVLGSATPSMESYHNAVTGRYELIVLERRILDRPLASVSIVDMRQEFAAQGPDVVVSRKLQAALEERLARREQSLVLLNRRGLATAIFCRQCGNTLECPNCSISLVVHGNGASRRARCHYCNFVAHVATACPSCAGPYLEQAGFGTERVEEEIRKELRGARVGRLDRDAIRRRGALDRVLSQFRSGDLDVLVGTQMIAKGHDFPRVTLVGVVSADVGLGLADFRASERTFQLLTQVAGRAGRGEERGEAIVQTIYPEHYAVQLACRQDYVAFYERELNFRKEMRYPPAVALINGVVRAPTFGRALADAEEIVRLVSKTGSHDFAVLGPAPAPLGRLRGEFRAQFLMKGTNRKRMREALQSVLAAKPSLARRTVVDVDPLSVM